MLALFLAILLAVARPAAAQAPPGEALGRFRWGPLFLTPAMTAREIGIDTNVFNSANDPQADFTATLSPYLELALRPRRWEVSASGRADLVYFGEFASERSVDTDLRGAVGFRLRRARLFATSDFLNTRQRPNFEIDIRSRRLESRTRIGVAVEVTPKIVVETAVNRHIFEYQSDVAVGGVSIRDLLNRQTDKADASLRYALTPLTNLLVQAEVVKSDFPFMPSRDRESFALFPGVEFKRRALLEGTFQVGHRRFINLGAGAREFSGMVMTGSLVMTRLRNTTVAFGAQRDVDYSLERLNPLYTLTSWNVSADRRVTPRIVLQGGMGRHTYDYAINAGQPGATPERVDRVWSALGGVGYVLNARTTVGVTASYWTRGSNTFTFRDYDRLLLGLNLHHAF